MTVCVLLSLITWQIILTYTEDEKTWETNIHIAYNCNLNMHFAISNGCCSLTTAKTVKTYMHLCKNIYGSRPMYDL